MASAIAPSGDQFRISAGGYDAVVTETGCEVFTLSPAGLHKPPYGA